MSKARARRGSGGAITRPLRPKKSDDVDIDDDFEVSDLPGDEGEAEGTSPIRFVLVFFGIPVLLLLVGGIIMTPCN